jgi:hypothetical protein
MNRDWSVPARALRVVSLDAIALTGCVVSVRDSELARIGA